MEFSPIGRLILMMYLNFGVGASGDLGMPKKN